MVSLSEYTERLNKFPPESNHHEPWRLAAFVRRVRVFKSGWSCLGIKQDTIPQRLVHQGSPPYWSYKQIKLSNGHHISHWGQSEELRLQFFTSASVFSSVGAGVAVPTALSTNGR